MGPILSGSEDLFRAYATNATDTSFPSRIPTTTQPASAGVFAGQVGKGTVYNLLLMPFGAGADNTTFDMRVLGWQKVQTLWMPIILAQFSCTLSAAVGIAGAAVINTDRFADTITQTALMGNANVDTIITSPANDTPGHILLDTKNCQLFEVTFDLTGATNANCLVGRV